MTTSSMTSALTELGQLLGAEHSFQSSQLRPPATRDMVRETADQLGVTPAEDLVALYGWHDGALPEDRSATYLYLFPPAWVFLPLDLVKSETKFAMEWCRDNGLEGFPFAKHDTGMFMAAGPDGRAWKVSWDLFLPAWPDGTLNGLVTGTGRALRGGDSRYSPQMSDLGMQWSGD